MIALFKGESKNKELLEKYEGIKQRYANMLINLAAYPAQSTNFRQRYKDLLVVGAELGNLECQINNKV